MFVWTLFQLVSIEDGYMVLMADNGDTREDLKLPEGGDLCNEIVDKYKKDEPITVSFCIMTGSWILCFMVASPSGKCNGYIIRILTLI